ncbi:hypothetical protein [Bifidobacterium sp. ESL0745]|uniref:hypothetical protein n=1 Tax=Bifidobacterium sp. ESL0745 TaxID=2983226 RepID=UPI0023F65042|nr:hypothetical protein [Bifidobacterium sp. ESL0745]MDF7666044.1 hypothetical protein [Bifidobacterium sp. ESL0745]
MKDDFDRGSNRAGVSRSRGRKDSRSDNAHMYNVNELRRHSPASLRKARHRRSLIISVIVVAVVIALIIVALSISLKTLKRNTASVAQSDPDTTTIQGKTKAPDTDANQMKQGIEQQSGVCTGGWMDVDVASKLPGATSASFCKATQVAFITFQTKAAASMDGDMVRSQAANVISQYGGSKVDPNNLRLVSNDLWMAVGNAKAMGALQQQWGGTLEKIGS